MFTVPQSGPNTLRFVPTDKCPRCGAEADPERFAVIFADTPVDGDGTVDSGNFCEDCFGDLQSELTN